MSAFKTVLSVECIDDLACDGRGIWRLQEPLEYYSDRLGKTIVVEAGFLTDFCSVPRVPILYGILGDRAHKSGVIHDWLFHHHEVCDEQAANEVLLEAMKVEGICGVYGWEIYMGVKLGGKSSWDEDGAGDGHKIIDGKIV